MKIFETRPREIDFDLWVHCQNLLDDPRTLIISPENTFIMFGQEVGHILSGILGFRASN